MLLRRDTGLAEAAVLTTSGEAERGAAVVTTFEAAALTLEAAALTFKAAAAAAAVLASGEGSRELTREFAQELARERVTGIEFTCSRIR